MPDAATSPSIPGPALLEAAHRLAGPMVELRRAIHRDPELGLQLPRTQQRILEALTGLGLDISTGRSITSVVAQLDTGRPGPTVLLRGDMDALPMTEDTDVEFRSVHEDRAHSCGHDSHVAMLVGAATVLTEARSELTGSIRFMFQPGEEGHHGARFMIEEGVLDGVDRAFAVHATPSIPAGMVATRPGPLMDSADTFHLTVRGKGGHASSPHHCTDPIPPACEIVTNLQTMVTRTVDPNQPGLLTVAHIAAGTATNVIPETADVEGTIRAFSERTRTTIHEGVERVATSIARAHDCSCSVHIEPGYPVTTNDPVQAALAAAVATDLLGESGYVQLPTPIMGAEDFSYVLDEVPGALAFLGVCPDDIANSLDAPPNHSNRMRLNEAAMPTGAALYAAMAMAG
ncbi:MAG: M20 family metallopeptidase [Acidimicrobiia bacterium]|nr:M20 family metallopeptidase [Acidimicrobiia bacterium]